MEFGILDSSKNELSFQFLGRKLLYDLTQKIKINASANMELFLNTITRLLLVINLRLSKSTSTQKKNSQGLRDDIMSSMAESLNQIVPRDLRKTLIEEANIVVSFMLQNKEEEKQSTFVNIGAEHGDEEEEKDKDNREKNTNVGQNTTQKDDGKEKRQEKSKRKRGTEGTDENYSDDEERDKKRQRTVLTDLVSDEMDEIASFIPEDNWIHIFSELPNLLDVMMVNKDWLKLVRILVASRLPHLLVGSDLLMRNFAEDVSVRSLVKGPLDLSWNDEITYTTLSKFTSLETLDLTGNEKMDIMGVKDMMNLKKISVAGSMVGTRRMLWLFPKLQEITSMGYFPLFGDLSFLPSMNPGPWSFPNISKIVIVHPNKKMEDLPYRRVEMEELFSDLKLSPNLKTFVDSTWTPLRVTNKMTAGLTRLTELVAGPMWSAKVIGKMTNLTSLTIRRAAENEQFDLSEDEEGTTLKNLTNLTSLKIAKFRNTWKKAGPAIGKLTRLNTLIMHHKDLNNDIPFSNLSNLTHLSLKHLTTKDAELYPLVNLNRLSLQITDVTGSCLQFMGSNITILRLRHVYFDSSNLKFVPNLTQLLFFANEPMSSISIRFSDLAALNNLTELAIEDHNIMYDLDSNVNTITRNQGLISAWKKLSKLKSLWIIGGHRGLLDNDAVNEVIGSTLINLTRLKIVNSKTLKDSCVMQLTQCISLTIENCTSITSHSLGSLVELEELKWHPVASEKNPVYGEYETLAELLAERISYAPLLKLRKLKKLVLFSANPSGEDESMKLIAERYALYRNLTNLLPVFRLQLLKQKDISPLVGNVLTRIDEYTQHIDMTGQFEMESDFLKKIFLEE